MNVAKKVNPHFREFVLDWQSKYYFLVGGYGSSKSYHIALKIILKLLEERRTCLVVRQVAETIRDSCFSLFVEIISSMDLEDVIKFTLSPMQIVFRNGSKIIFRGLDKVEKLKSINDISLVWIEECSEISRDAFNELQGRLRHPTLKLHVILSTNPVAKSNWTFKHFFERVKLDDNELYAKRIMRLGDVYLHHSLADDNFFLPEDYLATLDEMQSYDPDRYRIARLGRFGINGTRVLPQFEMMTHAEVMSAVENIPRKFKFTGMDFGFETSYNAVVRVAVDDENKFLYIYWEYYKNHMTDDETADALEKLGLRETREVIKADSAEPKAIRYYQKRGFNMVAAKKWNGGTRHARLDNTRKVKRFRKIFCSDACPNALREMGELIYKVDKDNEIIEDEFNIDAHCLSAVWYAIDAYDVVDIKNRFKRSDFGL